MSSNSGQNLLQFQLVSGGVCLQVLQDVRLQLRGEATLPLFSGAACTFTVTETGTARGFEPT